MWDAKNGGESLRGGAGKLRNHRNVVDVAKGQAGCASEMADQPAPSSSQSSKEVACAMADVAKGQAGSALAAYSNFAATTAVDPEDREFDLLSRGQRRQFGPPLLLRVSGGAW